MLDTLRRASTASITSELFKLGIRHSFMTGVAPLDPGYQMVGEAVTLRYLPYREDLNAAQSVADPEHPQRKTIDNIQAGGILVIDARGSLRSGTLGEILMARIKARGGAGMVTDGAVRDAAGIRGRRAAGVRRRASTPRPATPSTTPPTPTSRSSAAASP